MQCGEVLRRTFFFFFAWGQDHFGNQTKTLSTALIKSDLCIIKKNTTWVYPLKWSEEIRVFFSFCFTIIPSLLCTLMKANPSVEI